MDLILMEAATALNVRSQEKDDKLILAAFGGGFTWGSIYLKWAYDPE